MSKKGPQFARDFLDAELNTGATESYLVAFDVGGGGTYGTTITTAMELVSDVTPGSEITSFDRAQMTGSGAPTAWTIGTAAGITRAYNSSPITMGDNETGGNLTIAALAMVKTNTTLGGDASVSSDGNSVIKWFVNLASPGFLVPTTRTPQIPAGATDFTSGWVIQEA